MAQASGMGIRLDKDKIVIEEGVSEICDLFDIDDPYAAISEGTMIISCLPSRSEAVVDALQTKGIKSSVVGELTDPKEGITVIEDGKERPFEHPRVDPFWNAFYRALTDNK